MRIKILCVYIFVSIFVCICVNATISTQDTHYMEDQNLVYFYSDEQIGNPEIVQLLNDNQTVIMQWLQSDLIQNDLTSWKVYINYPANFVTGHYSIVEKSKSGIETYDIEVSHLGIFEKIKRFLNDFWSAIFN